MRHPSPHNNQKNKADTTTISKGSGCRNHSFPSKYQNKIKVIREMSTLIPEGGHEANPDSENWHGTAGRRNRLGDRSQDSSPNRVQVAEEDTLEDEQGYTYRSRGGDNDMLGNGRERLKRHRREVAGRVWIPEIWGQEELLKDWVDCTVLDSSLVLSKIMLAKVALVKERRRASSPALPIENRC